MAIQGCSKIIHVYEWPVSFQEICDVHISSMKPSSIN